MCLCSVLNDGRRVLYLRTKEKDRCRPAEIVAILKVQTLFNRFRVGVRHTRERRVKEREGVYLGNLFAKPISSSQAHDVLARSDLI